MKDFIEPGYPDLPGGKECSFDELNFIFREAWGSVTPDYFANFVMSKFRRCQVVIDAGSRYTKY